MTISANGSMRSLKRRKYGAIYADPPWSFRNWSAKGTGRNAVSHYDCISFERLTTLPIRDLAPRIASCSYGPLIRCLIRLLN